jgi:hypothetical protein
MKTSAFLASLRQHAGLPLVFRAQGETVSPGYHLTEVKRVNYETMDCGAMTHEWAETQFEIWVPAGAAAGDRGPMAASKFLRIVERVEAKLPLNGAAEARIHASFPGQPAALYDIAAVQAGAQELRIELTPDRTRCKAAERQLATAAGVAGTENAGEPAAAGCGCGVPAGAGKTTCCA